MSGDPFDHELERHVAPADWINPTPAARYHLVVIGGGPAGLVAAAGAAGLGAKVALIEKHRLGGDCLISGCVPSKALLKSARVAATVRDAAEFGVEVPVGTRVDFSAVLNRMRQLRASLAPHDSAERFRGLGVDVFFGAGRFAGRETIDIAGQTLRFRRALIATGGHAAVPDIPGLADAGFVTNETVFSLTSLPRRLVVIGAGPIGCELAQAFARFGSQVTLIASGSNILAKEDADAASVVEAALRRDGIELLTNARVSRANREGDEKQVWIERGGDSSGVMNCPTDEVLVAVGRVPNVDDLGLSSAGVEFDSQTGIRVDDHFRTTNRAVFAAGDVCSRFQFTHAADAMARIVLQNALFPGRGKGSSLVIPRCTYTAPEIAAVGLTEAEARERGVAVDVLVEEMSHNDRAVLDGETAGFAKMLLKRGTDQIVGATIVAANAGDMLNEITLVMAANLGLGALASTIHPYPTQGEVIKRLADQFSRRRLTPTVKWWFEKWFAWTS
ncbi:MAG: mercuric reductase [Planctomycetaceae bacterium]|nr:mercuric reductase [Planctomycetaceae bacterium]